MRVLIILLILISSCDSRSQCNYTPGRRYATQTRCVKEWAFTQYHLTSIGKTVVMMPTTVYICDEYATDTLWGNCKEQ